MSASNCLGATHLTVVDTEVYRTFTLEFQSLAGKGIAKDESGLLGKNREWGKLYSPRFQLGAGKALRIALVAKDFRSAKKAYFGIKKGTEAISKNGFVKTTIPPKIARGRSLSQGDIASAAAFYLGDACLGIIAVETSGVARKITSKASLENTKKALKRASEWLITQQRVLLKYDLHAPNRLLFDALAYYACGVLTPTEHTNTTTEIFVNNALQLLNPLGYFIEGGGWDTSYQAVSISVGKEVLLAGYQSAELENALYKAATWLQKRIDRKGRVDSTGNQRTCEGGESFLGTPKKIALDEVFMSLAYLGIMKKNPQLIDAAKRVSMWYSKNRGRDPCFSIHTESSQLNSIGSTK